MTLYDLIKKYGASKGEAAMWDAIKTMSEFAEDTKEEDPEEYWELLKDVYEDIAGPHFNEEFGMWQIEQMYFVDYQGMKHHAPNWTKDQYHAAFEAVRPKLKNKEYTCWDFAVALEMQYTDYHCMLKKWMPEITDDEIKSKAVDMAITYLNDDDDTEGGKIWDRYNG